MDLKGLMSGNFLGSFNFDTIINKLYFFGGLFLLGLIIGGIIFAFFYLKGRNKKSGDLVKLAWWEETTAGLIPSRSDMAEELIIPGTALRVFYVKDKDLWLPRFTRGITKDLFYIAITPNRQMINFTLKKIGDTLKESELEFDHTDMLWASENTREFVKRNYKDKSIKWWQAYQGVITTAIYIIVMTFSFIIILYFMRGLVRDIGNLIGLAGELIKQQCSNVATSGVIQG